MKHIFLINSVSSTESKRKKLFNRIVQTCKQESLDYDIHLTKGVGDAFAYARKIAETGIPVRFYACGGDSTLNDVAAAVYGIDTAEITAIPMGSNNNFIRNFGKNADFGDILSLIYGKTISIDLLNLNAKCCLNNTTIGFDRRCLSIQKKISKSKIITGRFAYHLAIFAAISANKKELLHFEYDDGTSETIRVALANIANGSYFGGGYQGAGNTADLQDGTFDLMLILPTSRFTFMRIMHAMRKGNILDTELSRKYIRIRECKKLTISKAEKIKYSLDGEPLKAEEIKVSILPASCKFVVPAEIASEFPAEK